MTIRVLFCLTLAVLLAGCSNMQEQAVTTDKYGDTTVYNIPPGDTNDYLKYEPGARPDSNYWWDRGVDAPTENDNPGNSYW
ncbi:MAG: hypothetical protein SFY92_02905 [Verrucomicrobiae bacterium]|nr:hypothetical protein [Verrucomicrobiae bacterium]